MNWSKIDCHFQCMVTTSQDYTSDRAHIAVIATPANGDVLVRNEKIVGGVYIDPAECMTVNRDPGMGSVASSELLFSGSRQRLDVTTHVSRWDS